MKETRVIVKPVVVYSIGHIAELGMAINICAKTVRRILKLNHNKIINRTLKKCRLLPR